MGASGCSLGGGWNPWRVNAPKVITASCLDNEMRRWTVVDYIVTWDYLSRGDDGEPTPVWGTLIVCYDPVAKFWVYSDAQTNGATDSPTQMLWSVFNVGDSQTELLPGHFPDWGALNENRRGTPLGSLNRTNIFDVAAFQKDFPGCDALFLATDQKRGNKAFFKKYGFTYVNLGNFAQVIQISFWRGEYSVRLSTDSYSELAEYMNKRGARR